MMKKGKRTILAALLTLVMMVGCLAMPPSGNVVRAAAKLKVTSAKTVAVNCSITIKTNVKCKFKSSNKKIATVSSKGVVKGKKAGKVKITVTSKKNKKQKKTVKITVKNQLVITAPEKSKAELYVGESTKIKTNLPSKFASSNTEVADVNNSGKVVAKKAGTAKITVTVKKNKKLKKTVTVTVKERPVTTEPTTTEDPDVTQTTEATTEEQTTENPVEKTVVGIEANYRGDKIPNNLDLIRSFGIKLEEVYSDGSKDEVVRTRYNANSIGYTITNMETINGKKYVTYTVSYKGFTDTMTMELIDLEEGQVYPTGLAQWYIGEAIQEGQEINLDDVKSELDYSDGSSSEVDVSTLRIINYYDYGPEGKKIYEYSIPCDYTFVDSNGNELYICVWSCSVDVPYE